MTDKREETNLWSTQDQIAAWLRDGILSGDFAAGSKLPSSREITKQWGAAAQTIRNAVTMLEKEELVYTRRGSGVFVRQHPQRTVVPAASKTPPADPDEQYKGIREAAGVESRERSELLQVEAVSAPVAVANAFGLTPGEAVLLRKQVLFLEDTPSEFVEVYLPLSLAEEVGLTRKRRFKGGVGRVLADAGYPTLRCIDKVSARWPTAEQFEALKMPTKLPVLRTFRVTYSTDDRPIEVSIMAKAGHLFELQYEF